MKNPVLALALALVAGLALLADPAKAGMLYVSNYLGNTISKIDSSGNVSTFSSSLLNNPYGIAFDAQGDLFVANSGNNSIVRITPDGTAHPFLSGGLLNAPSGLVFDTGGNMFVVQYNASNVLKITPGMTVSVWAGSNSLLSSNQSIAIRNNDVYTATSFRNPESVAKITPSGSVGTVSQYSSGGDLDVPAGLAFDASGNLFVSSYASDKVVKILANGSQSVFASGLDGPSGLALDENGDLFVANADGTTISRITPNGTVTTFANSGQLISPSGLAYRIVPIPEIDPATGGSALSLVAGVLVMIEQRRRRATRVA
jgi:sugar lactone lactonase YvrE